MSASLRGQCETNINRRPRGQTCITLLKQMIPNSLFENPIVVMKIQKCRRLTFQKFVLDFVIDILDLKFGILDLLIDILDFKIGILDLKSFILEKKIHFWI